MNLALIQSGYTPTIIPPILRADYLSAIREHQKQNGNDKTFCDFIAERVYESQKEIARLLHVEL